MGSHWTGPYTGPDILMGNKIVLHVFVSTLPSHTKQQCHHHQNTSRALSMATNKPNNNPLTHTHTNAHTWNAQHACTAQLPQPIGLNQPHHMQ